MRRVQWRGGCRVAALDERLSGCLTQITARPRPLRFRLLEPLLHLGFALTGVGTVLLGCILPRLSAQWHLRDKDAGLLLLVQFAASASGALLVRRNLWKTLAYGYGLFGAGAICIFLLQKNPYPHSLCMGSVLGWP